jgi:hypothetical protein
MKCKIIPAIVFIIAVATLGTTAVEAQTYQDIHLSVNGLEQLVGTANPELSTIPRGEVYATIHLDQPETISCSLKECVSQIDTDATFGGWQAKIKGTMGNQTAEIQLVNSQGVVEYTIILMPEKVQVTQNENRIGIPQMPNVPYEAYGIGIGLVILGVAIYARGRKIGTITRI